MGKIGDLPAIQGRRQFLAGGLAATGLIANRKAFAQKSRKRQFTLYDEILNRGRPTDLGLSPCNVVYQHEFFPQGADRSKFPNRFVTLALGEKYGKTGHFTSLDLELYYRHPKQLEWYTAISKDFRSTYGNGLLSHYQTVPAWLTRATLASRANSPRYKRWQADNERWFNALKPYINVFSPAQYTYHTDQNEWERRARAYAAECRRLDPTMPYIPYLWFDYHQFAGKALFDRPIPRQFWRRQLEVMHEIADGVIIWGGYKKPWDPTAGWWLETQAFMTQRL